MVSGDFNVEVTNNHLKSFCENYNLKALIKQPTKKHAAKILHLRTTLVMIDSILANFHRSLQSRCILKTGLSDADLMTVTVMRKKV